ncbi:MAG: hypothetical protein QW146_06095 [Candidatus Bathyarchaeia archaeon]
MAPRKADNRERTITFGKTALKIITIIPAKNSCVKLKLHARPKKRGRLKMKNIINADNTRAVTQPMTTRRRSSITKPA